MNEILKGIHYVVKHINSITGDEVIVAMFRDLVDARIYVTTIQCTYPNYKVEISKLKN